MPTASASSIVGQLRQSVLQHHHADLTDGQLLERFLHRSDEAAFATLVRRHGPMVLGVCKRLLRSVHDAEDAFQATFLVLFRKADSLLSRTTVGNWLYGVAYHTALKARVAIRKRQDKESQAFTRFAPSEESCPVMAMVDRVLHHLPDKYREPLVLCALEGKSRKEAAQQLGIPEGTLSSRLAAARRILAKRLAAQGVTLSSGTLVAFLCDRAVLAQVSNPLLVSTLNAVTSVAAGKAATGAMSAQAVAWTQGVLHAMLMKKLKISTVTLLVAALLAVLAAMLFQGNNVTAGQPEPKQEKTEPSKQSSAPDAPKKKLTQFEISADAHYVTVKLVVDGELYEAVAARVRYDEKTRILTLEGAGGVDVRLNRQQGRSRQEIRAHRIIYSMNSNTLQVEGSGTTKEK
jgi:RNA polymerase sigma factor (sigma-70 family)